MVLACLFRCFGGGETAQRLSATALAVRVSKDAPRRVIEWAGGGWNPDRVIAALALVEIRLARHGIDSAGGELHESWLGGWPCH